jgi:adenylyltransferase/sulfurtransferase
VNDQQLNRYSRHILLPQIDYAGQQRLLNARVLLVGLGGLGSPIAMYLASSGVGHLVISDFDQVDLGNLQRQIIHRHDDVGRQKVASAKDALEALNPDIRVEAIDRRLDGADLKRQIEQADVVIDASDNFATRFQLNEACFAATTPLVSGAVVRFEGQVTVFDPRSPSSPCLRCIYPENSNHQETCAENGVLAPLAGVIGSMQTTEALKLLMNIGRPLTGRLFIINGLEQVMRTVNASRDPHCPTCSRPADHSHAQTA